MNLRGSSQPELVLSSDPRRSTSEESFKSCGSDLYMILRKGTFEDLPQLVAIYREVFPDTTRSILGDKTCRQYFSSVLDNDSYDLVVAMKGAQMAGFVILHKNRCKSVGRAWILSDLQAICRLLLTSPKYVISRAAYRARSGFAHLGFRAKSSDVGPLQRGGFIDVLAVNGSNRGQGIGRLLLSHCIALATEQGVPSLGLSVAENNLSALSLYQALGFVRARYLPGEKTYIYDLEILPEKETRRVSP